jgi:UDP-glucose 4-epimerase
LSILVTGGAGYIGSHMVRQLVRAGRDVVVVDNLDRGHREAVDTQAVFYRADVADVDALERILREHAVECVIHFAALAYVGESVEQPERYYRNNTGGTMRLLEAMDRAAVKRIVFSSTCATYGVPERLPIVESNPQQPISPYGRSKWFVEQMLRDKAAADAEFGFTAFRYFNVAGCARDGSLGEDHDPETHLIPILLQAALGQRESVTVFGRDYPTPDGTCIRDYVHVEDICSAHLLAIDSTKAGDARCYNLGTGRGYSVDEVIAAVRKITARDIRIVDGPRRPGDPPSLFASSELAQGALGWHPQVPDLEAIVATAWNWFRTHPRGYRGGM